jgi:hypothetical protein
LAWIESHTVLSRHRKVKETARALRIRPAYLIGHLHLLWHAALEQAEDGDLTRWSDEFIAESADFPGDAPQFVQLLQDHGWLDGRLLHDWIDCAGKYLIGKYAKKHRPVLVEIWAKYGKIYGKADPNENPTEVQQESNQTPMTLLGKVGKDSSDLPPEGIAYRLPVRSEEAVALAAQRRGDPPTAKQEFWEPLCRIFGLEPRTQADELRLYEQCGDFRLKGATVSELERRAGIYRLSFPSVAFTPKAILTNWDNLKAPPPLKPGERVGKKLQALND